jgi:hypothetical protein
MARMKNLGTEKTIATGSAAVGEPRPKRSLLQKAANHPGAFR